MVCTHQPSSVEAVTEKSIAFPGQLAFSDPCPNVNADSKTQMPSKHELYPATPKYLQNHCELITQNSLCCYF